MKHIKKDLKNEPPALRLFRTTTPNASYERYTDKDINSGEDSPLKKALLEEQYSLCAYCMGRISLDRNKNGKPKIEVEHYLSQELAPGLDLSFGNMLGVCNGHTDDYPYTETFHHCDKTKGENGKMNGKVQLKKLNPLHSECENLVTYNLKGEIVPIVANDEDTEHDLNTVLNLNNKALLQRRKSCIEIVKEKMKKDRPNRQWDKRFIQKHLDNYLQIDTNGKLPPYCMVVVWFLRTLLSKDRYQ